MTASNLPAAQPDICRTATDSEKLTVLTRLFAAYPCRTPSDFRLVRPAYMQALEGVCQWALFAAERRINQNCLGHAFMPSPSELRAEIDRVMEPFRDASGGPPRKVDATDGRRQSALSMTRLAARVSLSAIGSGRRTIPAHPKWNRRDRRGRFRIIRTSRSKSPMRCGGR